MNTSETTNVHNVYFVPNEAYLGLLADGPNGGAVDRVGVFVDHHGNVLTPYVPCPPDLSKRGPSDADIIGRSHEHV